MYLVPSFLHSSRLIMHRPCVRKAVVLESELEMLGMSAVHSTKATTSPAPCRVF